MERPVVINTPNKLISFIVGPKDTIGDLKNRIWTQHAAAVAGLDQSQCTLAQLQYQQIVHEDNELVSDVILWNHLFEVNLPSVPSFDFNAMDKRTAARTSMGVSLQAASSAGVDDDRGSELLAMTSFVRSLEPPTAGHNNLSVDVSKAHPASLYIVPKHYNCEPAAKGFNPQAPYHFARICNMKVKSFLPTYSYDQRFIVAQGYMVFIYKSLKEFLQQAEPIEIFHIGGIGVYNTWTRTPDETKLNIVLKSNELHLAGPSALSIAAAFKARGTDGGPPTAPKADGSNGPNMPKTPTASSIGSKDDVVFLVPPSYLPAEEMVCGDFKRTDMSKPPKGFVVLSFDGDSVVHKAVYEFLRALKYQWLIEVCGSAASYLERRQLWGTEGIFRLSASQTLLEEVKTGLYAGQYRDISAFKDEHLYSNLIKVLVRELPESPLSPSLYRNWLECYIEFERMTKLANGNSAAVISGQTISANDAFLHNIAQVLHRLPYYICNFLSWLFPLLHHVSQFSTSSKMGFPNLSIVFAPNLLIAPIGRESLQGQLDSQRKINDLVTKLIEMGYKVFSPVDETNTPLQHVLMYDIHAKRHFNCVLDPIDLNNNNNSQNNSSAGSAAAAAPDTSSAAASSNSSSISQLRNDLTVDIPAVKTFITPVSPTIGTNNTLHRPESPISSRDDSHISHMIDTPKIASIVHNMHINQFDPTGGFNTPFDNDSITAGSQYDQNRIVDLPTPTHSLPPPPVGLPALPMDIDDDQPVQITPTHAGALIDDDDDESQHFDDDNNNDDDAEFANPQFQPSPKDLNTPAHSNVEEFERQQEEEYQRQQREVEEEQLREYQRLQEEQRSTDEKQRESRQQLTSAVASVGPFFANLQAQLENPQFVVTPAMQTAIWDLLQMVEDTSQLIDQQK